MTSQFLHCLCLVQSSPLMIGCGCYYGNCRLECRTSLDATVLWYNLNGFFALLPQVIGWSNVLWVTLIYILSMQGLIAIILPIPTRSGWTSPVLLPHLSRLHLCGLPYFLLASQRHFFIREYMPFVEKLVFIQVSFQGRIITLSWCCCHSSPS